MAEVRIKEEFKKTIIAFGGGGKVALGERKDLDKLAILAHESRDPTLLNLFESLPSLEELKRKSTDRQLAQAPKPAEKLVDKK